MDQFKSEITIFGSTLDEADPICSVILTDEALKAMESFTGSMKEISARREDGRWDVLFGLKFIKGIVEQKINNESLSDTILRIIATKRPSRSERRRMASNRYRE